MPSRLPPLPGTEPLDLRVAAGFIALIVALVAPGLAGAVSPLGADKLQDAAGTLGSQAREAVELIKRRDRLTTLMFSAELQDVGAAADETRTNLLHEAVEPSAESRRDQLADTASELADAAHDASLAADDPQQLADDRASLEKLVKTLDQLGGGS